MMVATAPRRGQRQGAGRRRRPPRPARPDAGERASAPPPITPADGAAGRVDRHLPQGGQRADARRPDGREEPGHEGDHDARPAKAMTSGVEMTVRPPAGTAQAEGVEQAFSRPPATPRPAATPMALRQHADHDRFDARPSRAPGGGWRRAPAAGRASPARWATRIEKVL